MDRVSEIEEGGGKVGVGVFMRGVIQAVKKRGERGRSAMSLYMHE